MDVGEKYVIFSLSAKGGAIIRIYLADARRTERGYVSRRTTEEIDGAQLFTKEFAEQILEWSDHVYYMKTPNALLIMDVIET